ncbi:MAG: serine--tRNA ligase [archaeon]|nr:MAG: serine--tRNA ligase [archaeon]
MLDPKLIREKPKDIKLVLKKRGLDVKLVDTWVKADKEFRDLKVKLDQLRHQRNVVSEAINKLNKAGKKKEAQEKIKEAKKIAEQTRKSEELMQKIEPKLNTLTLSFPNSVDKKCPDKEKIISKSGTPKKQKFQKDYLTLCKKLRIIDFESATNMSGEGFYLLKKDGATLLRALINLCLDTAKKDNYTEIQLPILLNEQAVTFSGHLPKFEEGMYKTREGLYLSPTEEVGLLNLYSKQNISLDKLPIHLTAYIPSFRTEKGATKGMFRVHQFDEVELFKVVHPKDSEKELKKMVETAVKPLKLLGLPYRIKLLPAWDLSTQNSITYDVEVFSPVSGWLEVSSCSNSLDFQARRARIHFVDGGKRDFVHTLNGTCLGLNRTFIALIENYQQKEGSIKIPTALQKYFGKKIIK